MYTDKSKSRWKNCFAGCAIGVSVTAYAQIDTPLEDLLKLPMEDLLNVRVNIASHFVEDQLHAGATTAIITEQQWQSQGARKVYDAIGLLPNTLVLPNWFGAEQIYIRGYADGNNSGGVATLLDGVAINTLEGSPQFYRQNIQLGILDRIEMIRGPGSALYGQNAFHGVFDMRVFESTEDVTRAAVSAADNGYNSYQARFSRAASASGWRLNIAAAHSAQPAQNREYSYIDPATGLTSQAKRPMRYGAQSLSIKLNSDAASDWRYSLGAYYDHNDTQGHYSQGTTGGVTQSVASRDTGGVDSPFAMVQGSASRRIDAKTSVEGKAYYFYNARTFNRTFSQMRDFTGEGAEQDYGAQLTFKQNEVFANTQWSARASLRNARMGEYKRKVTDAAGNPVAALTGKLAFSDYARDVRSLVVDAKTQFFDGGARLHYGGRYDYFNDFGDHFSPRIGLVLSHAGGGAAKFLYGNAFRAPNAGEIKGFASIESSPDIKPETIDTYEAIAMYQSAHTLTQLTVFKSEWHNAILLGPPATAGYTGQYVNTGHNHAYGAEGAFTLQLARLTMTASASYTRSGNDTTKQYYAAFPVYIGNAQVGYRFVEWRTTASVTQRIHLRANEGQYATSLPAPAPLRHFSRTDAHLEYQYNRQFALVFDIRNVFNRQNYLPSVQPNPSTGGLPDEPRSVLIGLHWSYTVI